MHDTTSKEALVTDERCLNPGCGRPMSTHKGPFCPERSLVSLAELEQTANGQPNEHGLVSVAPDALHALIEAVEAMYRWQIAPRNMTDLRRCRKRFDSAVEHFDFEGASV